MSLDPLQKKYPELSPYNYCANNPINFIDPDGKVIIPVRDNRYVYEFQVRTVLGQRDIKVQLLENPLSEHGFGVTTVQFFNQTGQGIQVQDLSYSLNTGTRKYDVTYTTHRFINASLQEGTRLNRLNPGLRDEVEAHEEGHVQQFDATINKSYSIKSGLETNSTNPRTGKIVTSDIMFNGKVDEILNQASNLFDKNADAFRQGRMTKDAYLKAIFQNTVGAMAADFQKKANPPGPVSDTKPLETDANARATKMLNARKIEPVYINGKRKTSLENGNQMNIGNIIKR